MIKSKIIDGFSKLNRSEKIDLISGSISESNEFKKLLESHMHPNPEIQNKYENFSENTFSNFFLPYNIAPNFKINGRVFHVPMVTEESSVVAAASAAAKFWSRLGGFKTQIKDNLKLGQVHFEYTGKALDLQKLLDDHKKALILKLLPYTTNMKLRGGGVVEIHLLDKTNLLENYFQLLVEFRTADSMGANFINTCLEVLAKEWGSLIIAKLPENETYTHIMSILSNYTPNCIASVELSCEIAEFDSVFPGMTGQEFVKKFKTAVDIARVDPYRAVTHNKGIYNGIDAVVLATGNDFRAVEACGHAFASKEGCYSSLSEVIVGDNRFKFRAEIPMSIGTIGGLTHLHPLAEHSLKLLGNPSAEELMQICSAVGLASNFSAVRSLVTSGIQKGHMKMHLGNILTSLGAAESEKNAVKSYFRDKTVSKAEVNQYLEKIRLNK